MEQEQIILDGIRNIKEEDRDDIIEKLVSSLIKRKNYGYINIRFKQIATKAIQIS